MQKQSNPSIDLFWVIVFILLVIYFMGT